MKSKINDIIRDEDDFRIPSMPRSLYFKKDAECSVQINEIVVLHTMLVLGLGLVRMFML